MNRYDSTSGFHTKGRSSQRRVGQVTPSIKAFELLRQPMPNGDKTKKYKSPFPSLEKRTADNRSQEIVDNLKHMILNPDRGDGKTGMNYRDWSKAAHEEITKAVREAETSAAFRELISANRLGGLSIRVGFLLLAAVSSFAAFWYGIIFIWREYGLIWGLSATLSAFGLSIAFTAAGLLYSDERREDAKRDALNRYK